MPPRRGPLVVKFFDYLEANGEEYWTVPTVAGETLPMPSELDEDEEEELFGAAYEDVTFRDSADDDEEGSVAEGGAIGAEFVLESLADHLTRRLGFLAALARMWLLAARQGSQRVEKASDEALRSWLETARGMQRDLLNLLDELAACRIPEPLGSQDSLIEYDRRRVLKEQVLYTAVGTCLDMFLAVGSLQAAENSGDTPSAEERSGRPAWEPLILTMEQAFLRGDFQASRRVLPEFLEAFRDEPLLFVPLAEGGQPRYILRARTAQTILRALVATLPRLGLLRETFHLLKTAWVMEQSQTVGGRGVTEFNHLFQTGLQAVVGTVIQSAATWDDGLSDEEADGRLIDLLESISGPFLHLWVEHSRSMQLAALEGIRTDEDWHSLREFVRWYGHDLFHARFMTLANLRGILHRGVASYLDYLRDNADPLHPIRLVEDLDKGLPRDRAERYLKIVLQAVTENYEEYKDYNTTVARSDYGENLYILLDFLRLKASYERNAWQIRPLVLVHEVLAHQGWTTAALRWQDQVGQATRELADEHGRALAQLQQAHGVRLGTLVDRIQERFIRPLSLDRLCALVEPAMKEAQQERPGEAFDQFREELREWTNDPTGVGLDVPHWLRRLDAEVHRVRATQTSLAVLAENLFQIPERRLSAEDIQQHLSDWDKPLGV